MDGAIGAEFTRAAILADKWDLRMLSSTLSLAYLASGRIGAYLLFELSSPVHTAAGALLSEEAGAIVTDRFGVAVDRRVSVDPGGGQPGAPRATSWR